MLAAANAPAPPQLNEDRASAKVAMRDEVCRRRKWLRFAWTRNQNWIDVAEAVEVEVDLETGHVRLADVICADDVGRGPSSASRQG